MFQICFVLTIIYYNWNLSNWKFEVLSCHFGGKYFLWIITDIVNAIQEVSIFIIEICNKRVLKI